MTMDQEEFDTDNRIDPDQLDLECLTQPEKFWKWSQRAIESKTEADTAKTALGAVEAQLALDCRLNPARYGIPKVTEASVDSVVKKHKDYLQAQAIYHKAQRESALLNHAVQTIEMRKRMLELLVTLHGQAYFAGPTCPRNLGEIALKQRDRSGKKTVEKQKKKLRRRKV